MTFWILQLQDLTTSMLELWNLMDTPIEEQQIFQNITCKIAAKEHEITEPNMLSMEFIAYVSNSIFLIILLDFENSTLGLNMMDLLLSRLRRKWAIWKN